MFIFVSFFQAFLRSGNSEPFFIQEVFDLQKNFHVSAAIEPMPRWCLPWSEYGKFGFPVPQDVGFNPDDPGDLANPEVELVGKLDLTHGIPEFRTD